MFKICFNNLTKISSDHNGGDIEIVKIIIWILVDFFCFFVVFKNIATKIVSAYTTPKYRIENDFN